jgi:hypothetical protein
MSYDGPGAPESTLPDAPPGGGAGPPPALLSGTSSCFFGRHDVAQKNTRRWFGATPHRRVDFKGLLAATPSIDWLDHSIGSAALLRNTPSSVNTLMLKVS